MKLYRILLVLIIAVYACQPPVVVNPDFNFSTMKTVSVSPITDFHSFPGSGDIVARSLIHHLMKLGLNVVEREKIGSIVDEVVLTQPANSDGQLDINLRSVDALIICTITEFTDGNVITIPITREDKGKTITTTTTQDKPIVIKEENGETQIEYETSTTEETTQFKGSVTKTEEIKYIDSRVGISIQLIHKRTGDILWSNAYWYNSLNLSRAVDYCVAGSVKPLKKLLK